MNRGIDIHSPLVSKDAKAKATEQIADQPGQRIRDYYYLISDSYGRHIYFARVSEQGAGSGDWVYTDSYVVIFESDGSFDSKTGIMKIKDLWHYQDELRAFKDRNGWDTAL